MKKYITIAALLAAGTAFANAATETFDATRNASVVFLFNVDNLRSVSDEEFAGASEVVSFLKFTGTWNYDSNTGHIGLANNGSSGDDQTGLWASWTKGSSSSNAMNIGLGSIFTSSTDWSNISAVSLAYSFSTPESDTGATTTNIALAIKHTDGSANTTYSVSKSDFHFGGSSGFAATGLELNDTYVSSYEFTNGTAFASAAAAEKAAVAAIPEPSAFGLLAGLGALALVASRRRRK